MLFSPFSKQICRQPLYKSNRTGRVVWGKLHLVLRSCFVAFVAMSSYSYVRSFPKHNICYPLATKMVSKREEENKSQSLSLLPKNIFTIEMWSWHLIASWKLWRLQNTLLEHPKLCPKIQFSEKWTKLWIWIFVPKMNKLLWFWCIYFCQNFNFHAIKVNDC